MIAFVLRLDDHPAMGCYRPVDRHPPIAIAGARPPLVEFPRRTILGASMQTIAPVTHDLGAFKVRRVLPSPGRTMVGPFIFVDEFGPARDENRRRHGRAAAPAHQPRHRHLSVRRRDPAPRQPRHRPGDPARRDQSDDRRQRHRPFRAEPGRGTRGGPAALRHADLAGAARRQGGDRSRRSIMCRAPACRSSRTRACRRGC